LASNFGNLERLLGDVSDWFLVGMAADPRVLECRANVVFHLDTHLLISGLIEQQAGRRALTSPSNLSKLPKLLANQLVKKEAVFRGNGLFRAGGRYSFQKLSTGLSRDYPQGHPIANSGDAKINLVWPKANCFECCAAITYSNWEIE
jgi:hypothetical protein